MQGVTPVTAVLTASCAHKNCRLSDQHTLTLHRRPKDLAHLNDTSCDCDARCHVLLQSPLGTRDLGKAFVGLPEAHAVEQIFTEAAADKRIPDPVDEIFGGGADAGERIEIVVVHS